MAFSLLSLTPVAALFQMGDILATAITQCFSIKILMQHSFFIHTFSEALFKG
jgi:hypothetical protein